MKPVKINPVARRFLIWSCRHYFKSEAFSCVRNLSEAQKVMICMPASIDRFAIAKEVLSLFADAFKGKTIFVFLPFLRTDGYLSTLPGFEIIFPQKEDLKTFSIPGEKFIQKVREYQFDISLDLDLEDTFFNRYIVLKCGIPIRIGPHRKDSYPFYNIQLTISTGKSDSREEYEGMAKVLNSLLAENRTSKSNPI